MKVFIVDKAGRTPTSESKKWILKSINDWKAISEVETRSGMDYLNPVKLLEQIEAGDIVALVKQYSVVALEVNERLVSHLEKSGSQNAFASLITYAGLSRD